MGGLANRPSQPSVAEGQPQVGQLESPSIQSQFSWSLQASEKQHFALLSCETESQIAAQKSSSSFRKAPSTATDVLPRKYTCRNTCKKNSIHCTSVNLNMVPS